MLEKAKEKTYREPYTKLEYARFADDQVVLINWHPSNKWLVEAVKRRIKEELAVLQVELNEEKSRVVDLTKGESFTFLDTTFAAFEAETENGGHFIRRSSRSARNCSKNCSGYLLPTNQNQFGK